MIIDHANAMPAATWHFLKANDAAIQIPDGLIVHPDVKTEGSFATGEGNAFDRALARAQQQWEAKHPALTAEMIAEREAYMAAEAETTYGGTAQSAYQANADAIEGARTLTAAFEHGTGAAAASFLTEAAKTRTVIHAQAGEQAMARITVRAHAGTISAAAIDIIAERKSTIELSILVDGTGDGPASENDPDAIVGFAGTTVRLFADADAHVSIARTQTLGEGLADIDDMGIFAHDRARIKISQAVLGATSAVAGLAGDLRGDCSRIDVDTRYLGQGAQRRDFNYMVRHHGTRTHCSMDAYGVLAGKSRKTLRATIDLVRGCKGAWGSEKENVLLVDEKVRNKTVPVILCSEDDVVGNHGATIGHIREGQLFYLQSRGISRTAAESMFVGALLEQAAACAVDQPARKAIVRLGDESIPGFAALFD